MFLHKNRTYIYKKYTYVTGIVINSINSSLKLLTISQNLIFNEMGKSENKKKWDKDQNNNKAK